ncbi:tetratricopeptide repeat protein [Streptomyces sp. NPDC058676]|uniref:tetratricopeptide repeat protein n=2 Tax=unclassified Streptomyces TaxID=2593676 RepID=UPI00364AFF96
MDAADAEIEVTDTGNATAASGATAVTGYRGPAPGTDGAPSAVRVSGTGDAIASEGGLANAGYIHQVSVEKLTMVQQRAPQEPAPWPHQVGVIPPRAHSFQHRAEADRLRAAVEGGGTAVLSQVLTGMGGVGKTQLAADYARAAWEEAGLDVLVWVTASARSPVVTGYAQASVELCRADPDDPEQAAKKFLGWLQPKASAKPCRWLIVLDDVADPDDLRGLWPPTSPYGRTLVTTRRRDAALIGEGRRRIEVGLFTEGEAVAYLTTSLAAHCRVEPVDQLTALASDLGYLPLALTQAAAYLIDSGLGVAAYCDLLADRATRLADTAPDRLPDEQAVAVAAAWSLSLDRADRLRPVGLARPMLQLAALLDANDIPQQVLTSEPALTHLAQHRTRTGPARARTRKWWPGKRQRSPAQAAREEAIGALRALHRLSLIDHTPTAAHPAVRVHQLIQRATRDALTPREFDQLARTAADALAAVWPEIERDTSLAQALRANTDALTGHAEDALYRPDAHDVLYRNGNSLGASGQVTAARHHFHHLATTARHHLGSDHPDTLIARHKLAVWQGYAGDAAGAAAAFAELLDDQLRVHGPDHPDTLDARSDLAYWRGEAGDAAGAAAAFAELLDDRLRAQGPDHPSTLSTRHGLASWRGEAGDAAGAAAALAELLDDRLRAQGPDHPDILSTRHGLALWQGYAGDAAGAAAAFAELLDDRLRAQGPDHPDTLITRHNLAYWRGEAGDAAGAAAALAELLDDRLRALGPNHPDTLSTRHGLASWRGEAGDAAGAAAALAELLDDQLRVHGPDHPDILSTRHNLAYWRGEAGDAAGAAAAFAELLDDRLRTQGPDHPHILTTRNSLADWRSRAGQDSPAVE